MKKLLFTLFLLIGIAVIQAQSLRNMGVITYKDLRKMNIQVEGNASEFSHLIPDEIKTEKELIFNESKTLYKSGVHEQSADESLGEEEVMIKISADSPEHVVYTDMIDGKMIEQKEFMTRRFIIERELQTQDWKITGRQKMILNYPSQEAEVQIDSMLVTAWFTPVIPVSGGPDKYNGLPGMILEVDMDNGNRKIYARKIELKEITGEELGKPKKGRKVTVQEFDQIVAEKTKEMGGQVEEGQMIMIEIRQE